MKRLTVWKELVIPMALSQSGIDCKGAIKVGKTKHLARNCDQTRAVSQEKKRSCFPFMRMTLLVNSGLIARVL